MAKIKSANKSVFHSGLIKRLKVNRNQSINLFAQHFFADLSMADLNQRHWEDVVASVQSCWKFYSNFDGEKAKIRIIPENSNLLVIEIASSNLPFLMDSIRMELNQLGLVLADVQQCLMSVSRIGRRFKIQDVGEPNESLIRLEVSAVTFPDDLSERLMRVLDLVDLVVEDFEPMCDQLLRCSEDASRVPGGYEASEFLKWAFDNNFVLLGYEEWSADGAGSLKRVPRARLGLAKPKKSADRIPLNIPDGIIDIERLPVKSKIHRPVYLESFTLCIRKGKRVTRVCRFMGLLTSAAYNQHPTELPVVRQKMGRIFAESGFVTTSHKGSELSHIFVMLPREELFFSPVEDLKYIVMEIFALQERELVRVFARQDRFFTSCYVYIPKEKYNTALRLRIQEILVRAFDADDVEFSTYFSGSVLTRTHFLLQTNKQKRVDLGAIEVELTALIRSWTEELQKLVRKQYEPDEAARINAAYKGTFPPGYRAHFPITSALDDLRHIEELSVADSLSLKFYEEDDASVRFKIFHLGGALPLSDVIPILENLGVKTIEEHPYELVLNGSGGKVWIHDFLLVFFTAPEAGIGSLQGIFEEAFKAIWRSGSENDAFNRLVPTATMNYRQVSVIRAYARYLGQLQNSSGQRFIAECVSRYADITKLLFMLFEQRFDPASLTKSRRTTRSTS